MSKLRTAVQADGSFEEEAINRGRNSLLAPSVQVWHDRG